MSGGLAMRRKRRAIASVDGPNAVDIHVGNRVRQRRTLLGLSQHKLGEKLGLTFQQVQKYERGANRISASRLFELAQILQVPISHFFDELAPEVRDGYASATVGSITSPPDAEQDALGRRETLELVRAYYGIRESAVRRKLLELAKSLSKAPA
jgi:transcriptional regulator with XRE-family HTH domain